ncbi:cyclase family protein [Bordetella petrii]|uniref:cyclase family protein n=1 Tax=Bordetella petrii TaxID=94624 RepID=UPI001A976F17|nr:cyclase family protein [Bordetella petrii]MBO1112053.1 cyclase family protein [Bordetella petrii]
MARRWKQRPDGSNWGDFGDDDQLGRLNLLTPQKVLEAVAEVRAGQAFSLSLPLDFPGGNVLNPARHPPRLTATRRDDKPVFLHSFAHDHNTTDVACDDMVTLCLQYSTQWDALSHIGSHFDADQDGRDEIVFYNGYRPDPDFSHPDATPDGASRAHRLGIEHMAATGVQGRGVMVDLRHHYGDARRRVGYDDLMAVIERDGVQVRRGDMLCLHTGFAEMVLSMQGRPDAARLAQSCAVLDGSDVRLRRWVDESGIAALIADNYAVEDRPYDFHGDGCHALLPLHELCLFKLGIHLGELWHLTPLAEWLRRHGRHAFLLTAPPLRLPGAVGSPLNPVATV